MFNMGSSPSLADIAAVTKDGNGDGWGNGNGWIFMEDKVRKPK